MKDFEKPSLLKTTNVTYSINSKEGSYIPRHVRQKIERDAWVDDAADYLVEIGVYKADKFQYASDRAKAFMHWNIDEGGELMEIDAKEFLREFIREVLEE